MKIEGSVALVTGANRGLGRALVSALVEAGAAKVYAAARDERQVPRGDSRIVPLTLDTTKPDQIAAAVKKAKDVTLLINNAGVSTSYNVLTMIPAELDADFRTNVHGTLGVIKTFLPVLERAPGGATIVNVLSLGALASVPSFGGYRFGCSCEPPCRYDDRARPLPTAPCGFFRALPRPADFSARDVGCRHTRSSSGKDGLTPCFTHCSVTTPKRSSGPGARRKTLRSWRSSRPSTSA
jgi:NAD(P)-dependent dehydrogenase (short-subunit alcohol dehydrogenase family)